MLDEKNSIDHQHNINALNKHIVNQYMIFPYHTINLTSFLYALLLFFPLFLYFSIMIYRSCGGCGVVDVLRKSPFQARRSVLKKVQFPDDLKGSENVTINILPEDVGSSVLNIDMLPGKVSSKVYF